MHIKTLKLIKCQAIITNFCSYPSETLAYRHHEVRFFLAGLHVQWDNCTVKTKKLSHLEEFYFKIKYLNSNEQLLLNFKIFHLSKKPQKLLDKP